MDAPVRSVAPPPPPRRGAPPPAPSAGSPAGNGGSFSVRSGKIAGAQRVVLYGPGGIGKSSLARLAPNAVFLDIEEGTRNLDAPRVEGIDSWSSLRACLQSSALDSYSTIVLDSATRAEEWAIGHTLATINNEKGDRVKSVEGYGFGKGYQHVYETFLLLLQDIDAQVRNGRSVILIAHDCTANVPNPGGEDFIRFEPHLQAPKSGKASIRERVFQWADHVLFLGYDVAVKEGKGRGAGTRTIYPAEMPTHRAKSRTLADPVVYKGADDGAIWTSIFGGGA